MMRLILRWLIAAAALWVTLVLVTMFVDKGAHVAGTDRPLLMLIAVAVLGFANAVVRPILKLLTLPLNCLTFGLFSFVINAALFWAAGAFTGAYQVSFLGALVGSIVMAIINGIASNLLVPEGERQG